MKYIVIALVLVLFFVFLNLENVKTGYDIDKLEKRKTELINYNKMLQVEVSKMKSLERVESVAKNDLGLSTPEKIETIVMVEKEEKDDGFFKKTLSFILKIF
jgi:cell division protein FtsL